MITTFIIRVIASAVALLLHLIPKAGAIPVQISDALTSIQPYFAAANKLFPVDTMLAIITLGLTIEAIILTAKFILWAYHLIRG